MLDINFDDKEKLYQMIAGIVAVTLILIGCLIILAPFFPAILLAVILTLSAWPAFSWLNTRLKNRTTISALLMTILLASCFIVPLTMIGSSTTENFTKIYKSVQSSFEGDTSGQISALLVKIPFAGTLLESYWQALASDRAHLAEIMHRYASSTTEILLKVGGIIGHGLLDLTLGVFISFFFFRYGSRVAVRARALIETFGGQKGQEMLNISKNTLIGVVYGIIGTAFLQGGLAALGFWIANVPGANLLGLITFLLSVTSIGVPLPWIIAAVWLLNTGATYSAVFLILWGIFIVGMVDNVLRPYFISRGSNLPFLLVLMGIIGGMVGFGFIGIFIGPTLLALAYALILSWSTSKEHVSSPGTSGISPPA